MATEKCLYLRGQKQQSHVIGHGATISYARQPAHLCAILVNKHAQVVTCQHSIDPQTCPIRSNLSK